LLTVGLLFLALKVPRTASMGEIDLHIN